MNHESHQNPDRLLLAQGNNYLDGRIVNLPVGNTEVAAKTIQGLTGGDLFHIETVKDYPSDYQKATEVAQQELSRNARPALNHQVDSMDGYGVVFLGYPNWWGTMPMAVWTFLEAHDFPGRPSSPSAPMKAAAWARANGTSSSCAPAPGSCGGSRSGAERAEGGKGHRRLAERGPRARLTGLIPKADRTMSITETATRNHEKWFPGHTSTLKVTDPEFIELFDNFAFDEVLGHGVLDDRTRLMTILAALIASQALGEFKVILGAALDLGVTPVEVKEVVYQAVPYCGIGKVFDFLHAANEVLAGRGVPLPLQGQSTTSAGTRYEQGLALSKATFGEMIDTMYRTAPADQQHINRFLSANCFGDYYTRTGLDLKTRELLTFSMLLALGCEPQMKGHIQGNLKVGNGREVLMDVITQLLPFVGYPRTLNAMRCLNEVVPESGKEG